MNQWRKHSCLQLHFVDETSTLLVARLARATVLDLFCVLARGQHLLIRSDPTRSYVLQACCRAEVPTHQ